MCLDRSFAVHYCSHDSLNHGLDGHSLRFTDQICLGVGHTQSLALRPERDIGYGSSKSCGQAIVAGTWPRLRSTRRSGMASTMGARS